MRLTEKEVLKRLRESAEQYRPFIFMGFEEEILLSDGVRADAIVEVSLEDGASFKALVEIASVANPKNVLEKCRELRDELNRRNEADLVPVIVAPYIGKRQAEILADEGISWIDLSGNMKVRVSKTIYIERTGKSNKFPDTAPIKKIFQGKSSLVSRALLLKPDGFYSLYEMADFINKRNANITISTVSKVLKTLEAELLITKKKFRILVTNAEKLLDRLTQGYIDFLKREERKKYRFATDEPKKVCYAFYSNQVDYASCGFYAAKLKGLATTDEVTIFVKDIGQARKVFELESMNVEPDAEFGNLILTETQNPCVWFNSSVQTFETVVDDIELYLEMTAATPRGPKIAEKLKNRILKSDGIDGQGNNTTTG